MPSRITGLSLKRKLLALVLCSLGTLLLGVTIGGWQLSLHTARANSSLQAAIANSSASENKAEALRAYSPISVTDVWGGAAESIALRSDGTVWTWGWDEFGMLGNGHGVAMTDTSPLYDELIPFQVLGENGVGHLTSIVAIAGGERHNVALDSSGHVWTWGMGSYAQLGIGTLPNCPTASIYDLNCMRATPVKIPNFSGVKAIASRGYHSLALKDDGTVWAWGWNGYGQIGTGFPSDSSFLSMEFSPVPVIGLTNTVHGKVIAISGGGDVSAALMEDHTLMTWGNNTLGAIGDGQTSPIAQYTPTQVLTSTGLLSITMIATGWNHMVALDANGYVWTWGAGVNGQLGNGLKGVGISSTVPIRVGGVLSNVIGVSAGDGSTAVLTADGHVWAWGLLRHGDGSNYDYGPTPVQVEGIEHVTLVRDRDWHILALKDDDTVWAWGSNQHGECGNNTVGGNTDTPVQVLFNLPTAPTITSALIVTGTIGVPVTYTLTAAGTLPITFTVTGLPAWANFNSPDISGTPNLNGAFPITLTATNEAGRDQKTLTVFVGPMFSVYLPLILR